MGFEANGKEYCLDKENNNNYYQIDRVANKWTTNKYAITPNNTRPLDFAYLTYPNNADGCHQIIINKGTVLADKSVQKAEVLDILTYQGCGEISDFILAGSAKNKAKSTKFDAAKYGELLQITGKLNEAIAGMGKQVSTVAIDVSNQKGIDSLLAEAKLKLKNYEVHKEQFEDVLVFTFVKTDLDMPTCEKTYLQAQIKGLQDTSTVYRLLPSWVKIPVSTAYYAYQSVFATFLCMTDSQKFPNQAGVANCSKAFVAGALHSVIEDLDILGMVTGIVGMAEAAVVGDLY